MEFKHMLVERKNLLSCYPFRNPPCDQDFKEVKLSETNFVHVLLRKIVAKLTLNQSRNFKAESLLKVCYFTFRTCLPNNLGIIPSLSKYIYFKFHPIMMLM